MAQFNQSNATKQAILDVLTAEQGSGGKIASVLSIGPVALPEANVYPYVGVELVHRQEVIRGNNRRMSSCTWGLNVSVKSTGLLADAYITRDAIIDDGAGNGVEPLIRGMLQSHLGGLVISCEIKNVVYSTNISDTKDSAATEYFAEAYIIFETLQFINA